MLDFYSSSYSEFTGQILQFIMGEDDMMMSLCFFGSYISARKKREKWEESPRNLPQALGPNMEEDPCGLHSRKRKIYIQSCQGRLPYTIAGNILPHPGLLVASRCSTVNFDRWLCTSPTVFNCFSAREELISTELASEDKGKVKAYLRTWHWNGKSIAARRATRQP